MKNIKIKLISSKNYGVENNIGCVEWFQKTKEFVFMGTIKTIIDDEYVELINEIKQKVQQARVYARRSVNIELVSLYWHIGSVLLKKQNIERWGSKYLSHVSKDLLMAMPELKGFSERNLKFMRQFCQEFPECEFGKQLVSQLPWGHIILLIQRVKDKTQRDWYICKAIDEGWSRHTLSLMVKSALYFRQETAFKVTNFKKTLPPVQSDMAHHMLKDPFYFDFVNLEDSHSERDIEQALVKDICDFLLSLGQGFAFVGNQYYLKIGQSDFYIDCLFYNFKMRCFVVIELKKGAFKAEYTGQLNLYLSGVDHLLKAEDDNPTIGIVLCESKDEIVAQYAVDGMAKPMGISQYELGKALTQHLKMHQDAGAHINKDDLLEA